MSCYIILHDLRSAHNVGAIFRTADAAGVERIYTTGTTPAPIDRFGRARNDISKTALGAEKTVAWEQREDIQGLIRELQGRSISVIAVEQSKGALDYRTLPSATPLAFIFGNEVDGLPQDILAAADAIAEIPMYGQKESLNVAVTAGIILFSSLEKR